MDVQAQFEVTFRPAQIVFGDGTISRTAELVRALGCANALVLSTPYQQPQAEDLSASIGELSAGVFANATMHTPVAVTEEALKIFKQCKADCTIAFGGGSTTGLGKALAYRTDMPQIVIPTTYAGSEVTPILGQTESGIKSTVSDPKILPEVVIYDPTLTYGLPYPMSINSALNALAHAAEALYAENRNPLTTLMARDGIKAIIAALPMIKKDHQSPDGRRKMFYGAWLCGSVLGAVGMALHHKLCHTLGGTFDLPHAETHAVILPHAMAFNEVVAGDLLAPMTEALSEAVPGSVSEAGLGSRLHAFAKSLAAPPSLKDLGMPRDGIDRAAELAVANPYWNPRKFSRDQMRQLIDNAYHGREPENLEA
ncbi:MAG: maleylacetate reductase [Paracoccaceae bacterium]